MVTTFIVPSFGDMATEILDVAIDKNEIDAALSSTGVLRQSSWYETSIVYLLAECFTFPDTFNEKQINNLIDIYYKQILQ